MTLKASLTMEAQVTSVTKWVFYQLGQVRQLVPYLSHSSSAIVIHVMVTSRMDYMGLLLRLTWKLQMVQNEAAQVLTGTPPRPAHIHLELGEPHWFSVELRIYFKVLMLTFKALGGQRSIYFCDCLSRNIPKRALRSIEQNLLVVLGLFGCPLPESGGLLFWLEPLKTV